MPLYDFSDTWEYLSMANYGATDIVYSIPTSPGQSIRYVYVGDMVDNEGVSLTMNFDDFWED